MTEFPKPLSSRIAGFYQWTTDERLGYLKQWADFQNEDMLPLSNGNALEIEIASRMIENNVGVYGLPLGIATNFLINNRDYLIPMVIEEPSVVAACSFAAKLVRSSGGFHTTSSPSVMIGQIQILGVHDMAMAKTNIEIAKPELLAQLNSAESTIINKGGGARDIEVHIFKETSVGPMMVVHILYDVLDAMGANAINTACEQIAPVLADLTRGRVNLRILSNLNDRRFAEATCQLPSTAFHHDPIQGDMVIDAILEAAVFAEIDPYRATTHNKGIMNGIDPIVIATGNDWRAVEAGAHAYAARGGQYTSMSKWWKDEAGNLRGSLKLPMAVGIVGGTTRVHPIAQLALRILKVQSARELAEIIVAVGLAQNLAAMRALATDGIQKGHMALHARQLALAAKAPPILVERIVEIMLAENNIRLERAKTLVKELSNA